MSEERVAAERQEPESGSELGLEASVDEVKSESSEVEGLASGEEGEDTPPPVLRRSQRKRVLTQKISNFASRLPVSPRSFQSLRGAEPPAATRKRSRPPATSTERAPLLPPPEMLGSLSESTECPTFSCFCGRPDNLQMIQCDGCLAWLHYSCQRLSRVCRPHLDRSRRHACLPALLLLQMPGTPQRQAPQRRARTSRHPPTRNGENLLRLTPQTPQNSNPQPPPLQPRLPHQQATGLRSAPRPGRPLHPPQHRPLPHVRRI